MVKLLDSKRFVTAAVTLLLLLTVGLGFLSVRAAGSKYSPSDLIVLEDPGKGWYTYEKGTDSNKTVAEATDVKVTSYTGVAPNKYGWWRIESGRVNFSFQGLATNDYGTWVIKNGKAQFQYNGLYHSGSNDWYVKGGKVQSSYTGAVKLTYNGESAWWRIENGKLNPTYKGVAKNEYGWWYFKDGKVDFSYTGVAKNNLGWWRIEDGKVNFSYNGIASNEYGSWYLKDGKVDFSYSGAFVLDGTMYVVQNGKVVVAQKFSVSSLERVRPEVTLRFNAAELSWSPAKTRDGKPVDGYEVYVKTAPGKAYSKVATLDGKTTEYLHVFGGNVDPTENTRIYDVRAIQKNAYGLVTARSPEPAQAAENNFVGGSFFLAPPDIVGVTPGVLTTSVEFKTVPYATEYDVYWGTYKGDGSVESLKKATTITAKGSGAGKAEDAKTGFTKGNQTASFRSQNGYDFITVQAVYKESGALGSTTYEQKSTYDTGFLLKQNALKGQNILFMGDSLLAGTPYGPSKPDYTISTRVAQQTGASTYNCAVGGAVLVSDYPRVVNNSVLHNQNIPVSNGTHENFTNGKWSNVTSMEDFDIVVLEGGPNDYFQRVPLGSPDSEKVSTFYGALHKHLSLLKQASRNRLEAGEARTKVVLVDLFYTPVGYVKNSLGLDYNDYSGVFKAIAEEYKADPDLDVYFFTGSDKVLNAKNYLYETVDEVHMTAFRYGQMGNFLSNFLRTLPEKDHSKDVLLPEPEPETTTEPATEPETKEEEATTKATTEISSETTTTTKHSEEEANVEK